MDAAHQACPDHPDSNALSLGHGGDSTCHDGAPSVGELKEAGRCVGRYDRLAKRGCSGQAVAPRLPGRDGLQPERPDGVLAAAVRIDDADRAVVESQERDPCSVR